MPERPSRLKLLANRKNALKSTGPRTYEGRQRAARNNTRHGFYSQDLILQGGREPESQEEYNHLAVGIFDSIRPRDEIELALTARIVSSLWQWRRALRFETACLTRAGCCWCENPFSHPLQRESLPARGATGGSSASACRVAHSSRSEGWGHDDGKRQSSLGTAHPDEGDFSASPRLPLPASGHFP